ncbi:MAG: putative peptidoglycan glycosyltransferase FtsW [Verrucomicrobiae bacterium]|nr:putative peptidoglycan glycosyltransferase FtsW [Verrucomicrobiae bacterium]
MKNKAAILLLIVTLMLVTVGIVMLFSTSSMQARDKYGDANYLLKRQLVWLSLGGVLCATVAATPYQKFRPYVPFLLVGAGVFLVLVLIPQIGIKVSGARRWLGLGSIRVQPSEFAKLALIFWLAHYLAKEKRRIDQFKRGFLVPMAVVGVTCLLILAEPDFGTTALLGAVALSMLFIAGVRLKFLVPTLLAGAVAFGVLIFHNPVRMQRMLAFTDLERYKAGPGYQVWQAMLAFGSGGISGLGLGNSRQKMFYLPEAHTDFIFPIVGEELGLIGSLVVLGCFAALIACGVVISLRAPDLFGQYLGLGATIMIGLQTIINVGVVTAWLPTKGLALPFISYGGSNVMMNLVTVGVLLSIYRHGTAESLPFEQEFFAQREPVT